MPFKSEKQRRFLWKFHPKIARKWAHDNAGKMKVSFDFHGVLENAAFQKEAIMMGNVHEVHLTTQSTFEHDRIRGIAEACKIAQDRVHFTNGEDKYMTLDANGIHVHYDDDPVQIALINSRCKNCVGVLV